MYILKLQYRIMSSPQSANTSACQVKWKGGLQTVLKGFSELGFGIHKTEKNLTKSEAPSPKHEIKTQQIKLGCFLLKQDKQCDIFGL